MQDCNSMSILFVDHFMLSLTLLPETKKEKENMSSVSYCSAIGSTMYAIVCTRLDIPYVSVVNRFMENHGKVL